MPAPIPLRPSSPSVEDFHSVQDRPTTPNHDPSRATHSVPDTSPISKGTSIRQNQEFDTGRVAKYDSNDYKQFIIQDFERHRVFVGIDDFMKHVLHVPDNWKVEWGPTIQEIKGSRIFDLHYKGYCKQCDTPGCKEETFYKPLVETISAILDICKSPQKFPESVRPRTPQWYIINDPKRLQHGTLDEGHLSPDIIALHKDLQDSFKEDETRDRRRRTTFLTWAHPLQVLEVKHFDAALVDGSCIPRLMVNGQDPNIDHAGHPEGSRYLKRAPTLKAPDLIMRGEAASIPVPMSSKAAKRPADASSEPSRKARKRNQKSAPSRSSVQAEGQTPQPEEGPHTKETDRQKKVYIQIGKYLFEQFSIPAFRSHATVGLVDRDRIQLYHANRSVILVSSAISFGSTDDKDGLDKLIAIVIAFSRLSLCDSGILHNPNNTQLFQDNQKLSTANNESSRDCVQEKNQLKLEKDGKSVTLTYGEVISHEPSLVGRSTAVLHAKSPNWVGKDLVVKISWPGAGRVSESLFLKEAIKAAKSTPNEWAINHLPDLLFDFDVDFGSDSTHGKVAKLFEGAEFVNGDYKYEERVLRIIVQGRLYPLKTLTDAKEIAQVLLDVACIHRWLYEVVRILHRDLSPKNIMYRRIDGKVYGVLNDFDLSSWTATLKTDYTRTSQQRTGTPPYMAAGLLKGIDTLHLYRHDVESLFYIMLILATHYEIYIPEEEGQQGGLRMRQGLKTLPFEAWFDQPLYTTLGSVKNDFLAGSAPLDLSPTFEEFRDWIEDLYRSFRRGFLSKRNYEEDLEDFRKGRGGRSGDELAPQFDDETLGGRVSYSTLIDPARHLRGKLEGLIVRYESQSASLNMASTGATQADT